MTLTAMLWETSMPLPKKTASRRETSFKHECGKDYTNMSTLFVDPRTRTSTQVICVEILYVPRVNDPERPAANGNLSPHQPGCHHYLSRSRCHHSHAASSQQRSSSMIHCQIISWEPNTNFYLSIYSYACFNFNYRIFNTIWSRLTVAFLASFVLWNGGLIAILVALVRRHTTNITIRRAWSSWILFGGVVQCKSKLPDMPQQEVLL